MKVVAAISAFITVSLGLVGCGGPSAPADPNVVTVASYKISKSPSGMFYDKVTDLLHILCGTNTNGDHYLYAYTTDGAEKCFITIPVAVGMTRVDGFYIVGDKAYIVDSQGPIYASEDGKLGGSVYQVDWSSHPCGCTSGGSCTSSTVTWTPTLLKNWAISATESTIGDGGGNDEHFRNSGIVVKGDSFYAVNGVHPIKGSYTDSYPKSLIKVNMSTALLKDAGFVSVDQKWSFDGATFERDVDMEALSCGTDECDSAIYIGDEYNYIYKLDLTSASPTKVHEWDCRSIVGDVPVDKGIESMTFDGTYWYIGIQQTAMVYKLTLTETGAATV